MSDQKRWKHGGTEYPLTAATTNSLLRDADPALYYAALMFESVLNTYVKPRLLAQAALEGFNLPSAVEKTLHFEPTPYVLADDLIFPLFCIYRSEEAWNERTVHAPEDLATWEWAYVLPPLMPRQIEQLHPILRSVAVVMREFAARSWDPSFEAGQTLLDLSGIRSMVPGPVRYGNFEAINKQDKFYHAVTGKLFVRERDSVVASAFESFDGANINIDADAGDGTKVTDFVQIETNLPPLIEEIAPASGTKVGGASFVITGRNFKLGTTPLVLIGGAYASSVRVTHPMKISGLTPEHDAFPTAAVDVQVIDADGSESNVLEAAYTFTTP